MDAPEVIDRLEDLSLVGREGYAPNRYTVPLRDAIDINDLVQGDGTMFETDLEQMAAFEEEESQSQYFDSEEVFHQLNYECNDFGDDSGSDKDEDVTPFRRLARAMEDLTEDKSRGVLKRVVRPGTGPVVPKGATVRYHLNGYVEFNDEPFDSSRLRGRPEVSKLDEVLPGLSIGISSMRKGEKSKFLITSEYAFKQFGCPPRVPPSATVLFDIELLSYIDHKAADDFEAFTEEEKKEASFEQLLKVANSEREAGNDFYKRKQVTRAMSKYLKAIRILENCNLQNADQERWMNEVLLKLYLNAAHCSLELGQPARVIKYSRKALEIDPRNVKALYRMGKAYMKESEFSRARDWFRKAQSYEPNNKAIKEAFMELDRYPWYQRLFCAFLGFDGFRFWYFCYIEKREEPLVTRVYFGKVNQFNTIEKNMCTRMFAQTSTVKKEESGDEKPVQQSAQLSEEKKEVLVKRLREFKEDSSAKEISFPPEALTQKEVSCIKQTAQELGLRVESNKGKASNKELKVIKDPTSEEAPAR